MRRLRSTTWLIVLALPVAAACNSVVGLDSLEFRADGGSSATASAAITGSGAAAGAAAGGDGGVGPGPGPASGPASSAAVGAGGGVVDDMVSVPGATFLDGCNTAVDVDCDADESPYHAVTITAFELDRLEVTQAAYQACIAAGSCTIPAGPFNPQNTPSLPALYLTWFQADAYCAWVGKRLPTEAEWELAARGTDGRKYPWGNTAPNCTLVNYSACGQNPHNVGAHPSGASPYGALDMAGNASEWVLDWYDPAYYSVSPATDPQGPASGTQRVRRGGSYTSVQGANAMRCSDRGSNDPGFAGDTRGVRCAR